MNDVSTRFPTSEQMSRSEAFDLAKRFTAEPPADVTRKLFYALNLQGECSWPAIVDYLRRNPRPND
ncbi:MAG: hypothetical protein QM756_46315 [Polyangiaceae bacterium]